MSTKIEELQGIRNRIDCVISEAYIFFSNDMMDHMRSHGIRLTNDLKDYDSSDYYSKDKLLSYIDRKIERLQEISCIVEELLPVTNNIEINIYPDSTESADEIAQQIMQKLKEKGVRF